MKQPERKSQKENILEIIHLFSSLSAASRKEIVTKRGLIWISDFCSVQFGLAAQLCLTLCNSMNHSMPGLPVHHQLLESTQTYVQCVGDAWPSKLTDSPLALPILWMRLSRHFFLNFIMVEFFLISRIFFWCFEFSPLCVHYTCIPVYYLSPAASSPVHDPQGSPVQPDLRWQSTMEPQDSDGCKKVTDYSFLKNFM